MNVYESVRDKIFDHETLALSSGPISGSTQLEGGAANHIVGTLSSRAANNSQKLHWQSSLIDLMELLGLDSSVANRRVLAQELSYSGDVTDAAAMDSWLHRAVMSKLAGNTPSR